MVLLTGAEGFLGGAAGRAFLEKGVKARALVLPGDPLEKHLPQGIEIVYGDVTDDVSLTNFFNAAR